MGIKVAKYLPNKGSIACFILSGLFFIIYKGIGSHVDIDGMLVEPFHIIPLGYLFLFVGMITLLFQFFLNTFLINIIKKSNGIDTNIFKSFKISSYTTLFNWMSVKHW